MTLFIDTTDNDLVKITLLVKDKKFSKQWRTRRLSETLMPQISALIEKNKKKISDLKKYLLLQKVPLNLPKKAKLMNGS